jgi:phage shock protein E
MNSSVSPLIIDVRSPGEFAAGHVRGAVNLPLDRFAQEIAQLVPNPQTPVLLYCAAGSRSGMACSFMQQQGYQQVSNGISAASVAMRLNLPIDSLR